jgi:hypothetical protein
MRAIGWCLAVVAALFLLDRLLLRVESAGWLYYRKTTPNPGALSSALANIHSMLQPEKLHIAEVQQQPAPEEPGQGAPPDLSALFVVSPVSEKKV